MDSTLHVIIDAQIRAKGNVGGVEQFIIGLVHALGELTDGNEEYSIVVSERPSDWLYPHLGSNQRLVIRPEPLPPVQKADIAETCKQLLGPFRSTASKMWRGVRAWAGSPIPPFQPSVPESNGYYESLGGDVVHFPHQGYVKCKLPTLFNPHDLQHLHFPEFFPEERLIWREAVYRAGCSLSHAVAAESFWGKHDIESHYGVSPDKVFAILRGAPTAIYGELEEDVLELVRKKFRLPEKFIFFPAKTYPHKNHLRLLEAMQLLRDQNDVETHLICTGAKSEFWPKIERRIGELSLESQVRFLGFVEPEELRALYRLAQFVVFPSLFEGGGFPVQEAFHEGAPLTCSDSTSITEYAGDAALVFHPDNVSEIAEAIYRMSTETELRTKLQDRGREQIKAFSWNKVARSYRALYRKVGNYPLTDEDMYLLREASTPVGDQQ